MLFSHQSCPILCQPMDCSTSGFPAHYLGFAQVQIHGISMPSNHLILCCPLLLLLSVFPSIRVFSIESAVCIRWPSIGASALALSFQWIFRVLLPLCSSVGKESTCNVGDSGSIPASGEGTGYPLQYSWASLVAQLVKNIPAMWEIWVWSPGEGNNYPLQYSGMDFLQYSCLENPMDGGAWWAAVHGVAKSDTTEWLHFHFSLSCIREGNGNPPQCSCLENPRDGGSWWAAVSGIAQSRTRLKWLSSSSSSSRIHGVTKSQTRLSDFFHFTYTLFT